MRVVVLLGLLLGPVALAGCGGKARDALGVDQARPEDAGPADTGMMMEAGPPSRPSCRGTPGAGQDCGLDHSTDCCASNAMPGGSFNRENDPQWPATISPFSLDVFEVTVGRFRSFVEAYPASRPRPGDGAHPALPTSGWDPAWDMYLPADQATLRTWMTCPVTSIPPDPTRALNVTWTDAPTDQERMPASCLSWTLAFAFCAWDGGRLPTDAEWNYAAEGGDEQRTHPWGEAPETNDRAVLLFGPTPTLGHTEVGSRPLGAGKWGHLDLGGSRFEYIRDHSQVQSTMEIDALLLPCHDCCALDPTWPGRIMEDKSFYQPPGASPPGYAKRGSTPINGFGDVAIGVRCARDPG